MSRILINTTGNAVDLTDIGRVVPASGQLEIDDKNLLAFGNSNVMWQKIGDGTLKYNDGTSDLTITQAVNHFYNYAQKFQIEDDRVLMADNRIPPGYSLSVRGEADDIANGAYGDGLELHFDSSNKDKTVQLLNHYYIIGARAIWENCSLDNYFKARLYAPATVGTNATGDFTKAATGLGFNMFVPLQTPDSGDWDLDLTEKLTNTNILKNALVPVAGNTGFFDYDSDTNVITPNYTMEGGYNLYDVDINLHSFGRKVWGRAGSGSQSGLDVSGLVGKKMFNFWKLQFKFDIKSGLLSTEKAAIIMILGEQGNIAPTESF